ncbi:MAG TPA: hypothetical protein VGI56_12475 [Galbitalea sp.]|jgi:hypothetical protein
MTKTAAPIEERFWRRVDVRSNEECWNWTGAADADGRGRIWHKGRNVVAPRISLIIAGIDVPPGAFVCHTCDNPPCVNPNHLYVGDAATNVRDRTERGRTRGHGPLTMLRGERNPAAKLSNQQVTDIRTSYTGTRGEQTNLAALYGVSVALISIIVKGQHRA